MEYSRTKRRARSRKSVLRLWLRKNSFYLFTAAVFAIGMAVGAIMVVAVISLNPKDDVVAAFTEDANSYPFVITVDAVSSQTEPEEQEDEEAWEEYIATAYCACEKCCGVYAYNRPTDENGKQIVYTASGDIAVEGVTIAADWSVLPKGTVVEIEGYGEFIVQDRGGAVVGNRIDIYFESHQEALEWGVKTVKLKVIEIGGEES